MQQTSAIASHETAELQEIKYCSYMQLNSAVISIEIVQLQAIK